MTDHSWLMERTTTWIAAGAAINPIWLPGLNSMSDILAVLLQLLGVIWLVVQIYFKLRSGK